MPEGLAPISSSRIATGDIARHSFAVVRRGFDTDEVRAYLQSVSRSIEALEEREQELRDADRLYNAGQADAGRAAVDSVVAYSDKACDATNQARNKIKNTEIAIRKMAAKLRDIKRSLVFEDQAPVQAAADHLEKLRTSLLARMFAKDN